MDFLEAIRFLTIIPVPASRATPAGLARSMPYFPLVGLIIGLILGGLWLALRLVFPQIVVGALLVTCLAILTGGHHLDGLADTSDALVAGRTREQRLAIMSDTRVGAFGITGLALILLIKYACITANTTLSAIIIFPLLARWALCGAILVFPAAKSSGMGADAKRNAGWPEFLAATLICLVPTITLAGLVECLLLMLATFLLVMALGLLFSRLFGGLTGDNYGALVETGEALALLTLIALTPLFTHLPGNGLLKLPTPMG